MAAAISAAAVSVGEAAVPALLIAPGNLPSALGAGERRAPAGAVDLSPIAATADQHLGPAALAEEEAAGVLENGLVTAAATWTQNGVGAIISRQSCPARFRARRRCELPSCRSAPRLLPRPVERLKHATRSCQRPPAKPRPPDLNHPADNLPRAHPRVHPTGPQATSHGLHGIPRRPPRKPQSRRRRRISALPDARQHDASVARLVLARDALGGRSHSPRQPAPQIGRLVSEARTLLQRRNRRRSTVAVESADFINIPAR